MNKADFTEKDSERLQDIIDEKKYEIENLLAIEEQAKKKLRAIEKEKERLYNLILKYEEEMHLLKMQADIAKCEIHKAGVLQKDLESENELLGEKRVSELKLVLAKQEYELGNLNHELTHIKDSLVRCHQKDAKMWNAKLVEASKEKEYLCSEITKTKMQLEFAAAMQKKSENRKEEK